MTTPAVPVQDIEAVAVPSPRTEVREWTDVPAGNKPLPGARHDMPRWLRRYVVAALAADLAAAVVSCLGWRVLQSAPLAGAGAAAVALAFPLLWAGLTHLSGGYEPGSLGAGSDEFRALLRAGLCVLAGICVLSYALDLNLARGFVVVAVPATVVVSSLGRYALRRRVHALRARGRCMRSVVAVGRDRAVLDLIGQLRLERHCGMEVVAACVPDPSAADGLRAAGVPTIGDLDNVAGTVRRLGADVVAVTNSSETAAAYLRRLSWDLEGTGVELLVAPGVMEIAGPRMHLRPFIGLPLLHVEEPEFVGMKRLVKTALDRTAAGAALLLLAPVLLVIALAVWLDSPGPVLFRQVRVGKGGREFRMLKFRSMVTDAEARRALLMEQNLNADGLLFKMLDDPRVTRVGRVLRRLSLDELPQLVNVLTGHMSLVGPRPPLPEEVALYDDSVRRRLLVQPGLTGLWQVSGRSDLTWEESVRLDLRYVENWSLLLDLMILWKTAFAVVRARGAY